MSPVELEYKVYLLRLLTQSIDDVIDQEHLTYKEFCEKFIEKKGGTCYNGLDSK